MSGIKLTEVYSVGNGSQKKYSLRQVYLNPNHIVYMREEEALQRLLSEGRLMDGMDKRQTFTRITVNNNSTQQDILVVGNVDAIYEKLKLETKSLLRG
tara:strand:+ start:385 stop:678 length:294 start_codon:yes stop_codon:yes gene_type:complete